MHGCPESMSYSYWDLWHFSPAQKAGFWAEPFFSYIVFFQLVLVAKGTHFKNLTGAGLAPLGSLRNRAFSSFG